MDRAGTAVRPLISRQDERHATTIGRHARLELVFGVRGGRTVLTHQYAEPPLRIGRCFEEGHGVHLILASSAPGLFGGDTFEQVISLEEGALVRLTSQSALQLHPSAGNLPATIVSTFRVGSGAELTCAWDPLIPFAGASLEQRIDIDVEPGGRVSWADALMSGREGAGERWAFRSLSHQLRLRRGDTLAYLERYRIQPDVRAVSGPWVAGNAGYVGTTLRAGMGDTWPVAELLHGRLAALDAVVASADVLDEDLLLVRIAAENGVPFHRARRVVAEALDEIRSGS